MKKITFGILGIFVCFILISLFWDIFAMKGLYLLNFKFKGMIISHFNLIGNLNIISIIDLLFIVVGGYFIGSNKYIKEYIYKYWVKILVIFVIFLISIYGLLGHYEKIEKEKHNKARQERYKELIQNINNKFEINNKNIKNTKKVVNINNKSNNGDTIISTGNLNTKKIDLNENSINVDIITSTGGLNTNKKDYSKSILKTVNCGEIINFYKKIIKIKRKSKLISLDIIKNNFYSVTSKINKENNEVTLLLEKISCISGEGNILYSKKGPNTLHGGNDTIINTINIEGLYDNKLLFSTNEEGGISVYKSNYLYNLGNSKLIKLITNGDIQYIKIGQKGIYILYNRLLSNGKLVLIDKNDKQINLFEDTRSNEDLGNEVLPKNYLYLEKFELITNKIIKLFLEKGNGTKDIEYIEKFITID